MVVPTWSFTLRLNRVPTDDELDALFDAGLDDSTPEGELLHVDRDADRMVDAVWGAARQVSSVTGLRAVRLERDDAVTLREIAQRLGRSYESVRLIAAGARGPGGFPQPALDTSAGRIWSWIDVSEWLVRSYPDAIPAIDVVGPEFEAADAVVRFAASYADADADYRRRLAAVVREVAA